MENSQQFLFFAEKRMNVTKDDNQERGQIVMNDVCAKNPIHKCRY